MRQGDTFGGIIRVIAGTSVRVITHPVAFFQTMPKQGGFRAPFVFLLVIGLFDMLLLSLLQAVVMGPAGGLAFAERAFALAPIALTVSGFVLTTVFFVFWRLMGSSQSYETAYRTFAYSYGISPLTTILGFFPYVSLIGFLWWFSLLVIASVYVHGVSRFKATFVFGVLAVALLVFIGRAEHYMVRHRLGPVPHAARMASQTPAGAARV